MGALGIDKLISGAMNTISSSVGDAVSRLDTLNNYPKVMANLGISSEESSKSMEKLSNGLKGLPTTLNDAVSSVQRFTSANNDVDKSTNYFLALNNALLAGGASAEIQSNALEQLSQMYAVGTVDAQAWRSVLTAMPAQLQQVATSMGYTSTAVSGDFYTAIQNGTISIDDFMDAMVTLNTEGTGEFLSFEEQAKNATNGIATNVTNMKTAVTRGVAKIIDSIDKVLANAGLGGIGQIIANIGTYAENALDGIASAINNIDWTTAINGIIKLFDIIKSLAPAIITVTSAIAGYSVAMKAISIAGQISKFASLGKTFLSLIPSIKSVKDAMLLLNMAFSLNPVGLVVAGIVALIAIFVVLWNKCDWFREFWINLWNSIVEFIQPVWDSIKEVATSAIGSIVNAFQSAWELIKVVWDLVSPYFTILFNQIMVYVNFAKDTIVNAFQLAWTVIQAVWSVVGAYFQAVFDTIAGIFTVVKDVLSGDFQGAWEAIKGIFASWGNYFQTLMNAIKSIFSGVVTFFRNMFGSAWNAIKSTFSNFTSFFKNLFTGLENIGHNIVTGIWNGISNAKDWLLNKIKEFATSITDGIKKFLGIASPSKVMRDQVGKYIPSGIAVGIEANTKSIDKAVDKMNDAMLSKMQSAVNMETGRISANATVRSNANYNSVVQVNATFDGNVDIDGKKAGRIITPYVTQTIKTGGLA